jgi:hypothetical protein
VNVLASRAVFGRGSPETMNFSGPQTSPCILQSVESIVVSARPCCLHS